MESNLNHEQAITNCLRKQALVGKRLKKRRLSGDQVRNCSLLYNSDLDGNAEKPIQ
jgi:hypothetical protein